MKKRISAIVLSMVMCLSVGLTGCGVAEEKAETKDTEQNSQTMLGGDEDVRPNLEIKVDEITKDTCKGEIKTVENPRGDEIISVGDKIVIQHSGEIDDFFDRYGTDTFSYDKLPDGATVWISYNESELTKNGDGVFETDIRNSENLMCTADAEMKK